MNYDTVSIPDRQAVYGKAFALLLLFHSLIWLSLGMFLDLHPDEADHWVWSQHLSWGYYEHPPMIAWAIRFFTLLLGNNQWALEVGSQTITLLSFLALFLLTRKFFGARAAFFSVLALEATPLFTVGSMIFVIDTVLILFVLWAALLFWKGLDQDKPGYFYWSGLALGLALLSKITAVLFPFSCLIFLFFSPKGRKALRSPHLYLACLLSLVVFSPFVYWNMSHGWISIQAQLEKGLTGSRNWDQVLGFWFGQPLILGPVLFFFFIKALWSGCRNFTRDPRNTFLVTLTLIPLLVFGLAAFKGKYSDPTWTDIGWPFAAVLVGRYFSDRLSGEGARKLLAAAGLIFATSWLPMGLVAVHALHPFLPVASTHDRTLEMRGWRQLGAALGPIYQRIFPKSPQVYVLADDYQLAGAVSFYTSQHPVPYSFSKSKRNIWITQEALKREGALLVCKPENCDQDRDKTKSIFHRAEYLSEIPIYRQGEIVKTFKVYYCSN
jgi:4-amino-4-deoxy-L-arabinose transferase-like glycosyltransferase